MVRRRVVELRRSCNVHDFNLHRVVPVLQTTQDGQEGQPAGAAAAPPPYVASVQPQTAEGYPQPAVAYGAQPTYVAMAPGQPQPQPQYVAMGQPQPQYVAVAPGQPQPLMAQQPQVMYTAGSPPPN